MLLPFLVCLFLFVCCYLFFVICFVGVGLAVDVNFCAFLSSR